jgi:hypothetical protein
LVKIIAALAGRRDNGVATVAVRQKVSRVYSRAGVVTLVELWTFQVR